MDKKLNSAEHISIIGSLHTHYPLFHKEPG